MSNQRISVAIMLCSIATTQTSSSFGEKSGAVRMGANRRIPHAATQSRFIDQSLYSKNRVELLTKIEEAKARGYTKIPIAFGYEPDQPLLTQLCKLLGEKWLRANTHEEEGQINVPYRGIYSFGLEIHPRIYSHTISLATLAKALQAPVKELNPTTRDTTKLINKLQNEFITLLQESLPRDLSRYKQVLDLQESDLPKSVSAANLEKTLDRFFFSSAHGQSANPVSWWHDAAQLDHWLPKSKFMTPLYGMPGFGSEIEAKMQWMRALHDNTAKIPSAELLKSLPAFYEEEAPQTQTIEKLLTRRAQDPLFQTLVNDLGVGPEAAFYLIESNQIRNYETLGRVFARFPNQASLVNLLKQRTLESHGSDRRSEERVKEVEPDVLNRIAFDLSHGAAERATRLALLFSEKYGDKHYLRLTTRFPTEGMPDNIVLNL